ncbi:MAG: hypothetical protein PHR44_03565 [Candidatus Omnitrophica bacterium]|nr:hypothetical protein [Candidatus Omnitrophota bacterium]
MLAKKTLGGKIFLTLPPFSSITFLAYCISSRVTVERTTTASSSGL